MTVSPRIRRRSSGSERIAAEDLWVEPAAADDGDLVAT